MNALLAPPLAGVDCCRDLPEQHGPADLAESAELARDQLLDGRFRIAEPISRGGMAVIYRAEDLDNGGVEVAVKVPFARFARDPAYVARFQREEEIGLKLNHPFLLKFIPVTVPKSRLYLVTECLSGCTLAHLLHKRKTLPERDALKIASLVCDALTYLHGQGYLHRDLKTENIMLCRDQSIRVMDFGLAIPKTRRWDVLADWMPIFGTPQYMAPEQVKRSHNDDRTDVYSLGVVLYEMLTGRLPFVHDDPWVAAQSRVKGDPPAPRTINPNISVEAEEIVLHALRRKPTERYATAAAFQIELETPAAVKVTGLSERLRPPRFVMSVEQAQIVTGLGISLGAIVGLIGLFFILLHFINHHSPPGH